jgi:NAD(P)-dependent dehydrogenase (short-subunit alcohol dehydrogenase family)
MRLNGRCVSSRDRSGHGPYVGLAWAHIVVIDITENVNEAAGQIAADFPRTSTLGVRCNVASRAACVEAAAEVSRTFDRVDALIHCAGIIRGGRYDEIGETDFDDVIAINLTVAFNIIRAFASTLVAQGSGSSMPPRSQRNVAAGWLVARIMRHRKVAGSV